MYSYEDQMRVVELYIKHDLQTETAVRELGYTTARNLCRWYKEYQEKGYLYQRTVRISKYTETQKQAAIEYYLEHGKTFHVWCDLLAIQIEILCFIGLAKRLPTVKTSYF